MSSERHTEGADGDANAWLPGKPSVRGTRKPSRELEHGRVTLARRSISMRIAPIGRGDAPPPGPYRRKRVSRCHVIASLLGLSALRRGTPISVPALA